MNKTNYVVMLVVANLAVSAWSLTEAQNAEERLSTLVKHQTERDTHSISQAYSDIAQSPRLSNIISNYLDSENRIELHRSDLPIVYAYKAEIDKDQVETNFFSQKLAMSMTRVEATKNEAGWLVRGKWQLSVSPDSSYGETFPTGVLLAMHDETISLPDCSGLGRQLYISQAELVPVGKQPVGFNSVQNKNYFTVRFNTSNPMSVVRHRALLDLRCLPLQEKADTEDNIFDSAQ